MSNKYEVVTAELVDFGTQLDKLHDGLRDSAGMVGSCAGDPGIFGVVGQVFGIDASIHCADAGSQLRTYSEKIADFADKIRESAKRYAEEEDEVVSTISEYKV